MERTKATIAPQNAATTTPASSRTLTSITVLDAVATPKTSKSARTAPAKAARGTAHSWLTAQPTVKARTAPKAAPPEMPNM